LTSLPPTDPVVVTVVAVEADSVVAVAVASAVDVVVVSVAAVAVASAVVVAVASAVDVVVIAVAVVASAVVAVVEEVDLHPVLPSKPTRALSRPSLALR